VEGDDPPLQAGGRRTSVERRSAWRRVVLLGAPLALAIMEIFHLQPCGAGYAIEQGGWFIWFHII